MSNSAPSPALAGEVSKRSEDGGGAHTPDIQFSPPEHITVQILQDLSAPDCSFELIAQKANTSVVALTLWMTRPDIAARIDALESAFARRSRLTIAGYTSFMLGALGRVIEQYNHTESHTLHREGDLKARALLVRNRENLVDAGKLLLRLTNAFPARPAPAPSAPSPALAGELAERSKAGGGTRTAPSTATTSSTVATGGSPARDERRSPQEPKRPYPSTQDPTSNAPSTSTDLHALRAARFPASPALAGEAAERSKAGGGAHIPRPQNSSKSHADSARTTPILPIPLPVLQTHTSPTRASRPLHPARAP